MNTDETGREDFFLTREELPVPLSFALTAFENETEPFRKVHRLIDTIEVLVKLHTVIMVARFFESGHISDSLKGMLCQGLRTPSLGIWWAFAREFTKELKHKESESFAPGIRRYLSKKGLLFKEMEREDNLIRLRNTYAHGATPTDEQCLNDIRAYGPRVHDLIARAFHFRHVRLMVHGMDDGLQQKANPSDQAESDVSESHRPGCYLAGDRDVLFSLHPLLIYREDTGLFYFYNDLRKTDVRFLNYENCHHFRDHLLRKDLLLKYPIDQKKGFETDIFKDMIEALTETFKGRQTELRKLSTFLSSRQRGFLFVWGGPGVGKTTLLARAIQMFRWKTELRQQAAIDFDIQDGHLHVIEYFIRRDMGTNHTEDFLDHMFSRIESRFRTGILYSGRSIRDRVKSVQKQLELVSKKMAHDERLVLIIDGLDEGSEIPQLLESLPRVVPDRTLVIYASRVHPDVRAKVYDNLDRENHEQITLSGLDADATRALLYDHINKYQLENGYVERLMEKSGGNPLYIKLICQGLMEQDYQLNDSVNLPEKLEEIYAKVMQRLAGFPGANDLLKLLASAKDFLCVEMMSDLLSMSVDEIEHGVLRHCMEVLTENTANGNVKTYQLFHESLRDYITGHKNYAGELQLWQDRLISQALTWENLKRYPLVYAMYHLISHLYDVYIQADKDDDSLKQASLLESMISIVENETFRNTVFRQCGNAQPLQNGLKSIQTLLVRADKDGSNMGRIIRFARMIHDEVDRMYGTQLQVLDTSAGQGDLGQAAEIIKMGSTPRDRMMLALRAMNEAAPGTKVPLKLKRAGEEFLIELSDPILERLWKLTLQKTSSTFSSRLPDILPTPDRI